MRRAARRMARLASVLVSLGLPVAACSRLGQRLLLSRPAASRSATSCELSHASCSHELSHAPCSHELSHAPCSPRCHMRLIRSKQSSELHETGGHKAGHRTSASMGPLRARYEPLAYSVSGTCSSRLLLPVQSRTGYQIVLNACFKVQFSGAVLATGCIICSIHPQLLVAGSSEGL
jgi:hypothetical protein